jgi:trimethylamine--corrinoid protein Co-methyltransferase
MMACAALARFYNLPVWGYAGATDSKVVDAQAGVEITFAILNAFLGRSTLNHDVSSMKYGSTPSAELMLIAGEINDMVRYLLTGDDIEERALGRAVPDLAVHD